MEEYLGTIKVFAFNFTPAGYLPCTGQIVPINQNQALFALLGNNFGGDGKTNFGLPDLRGRAVVGSGQLTGGANYIFAQKTGVETVTLTTGNLPSHIHSATSVLNAEGLVGDKPGPSNRLLAAGTNIYKDPDPNTPNLPMSSESVTTTIGATGGNVPVNVVNPILPLNCCICISGFYPSRN